MPKPVPIEKEQPHFDFNEWSHLARTDPQAFEVRRAQVIERAIRRAPPEKQQRLRGLQWRVDQERARCASPMAACVRISQMMWESLLGEHGLLDTLQNPGRQIQRPSADILAFRPAAEAPAC